MGVSRLLTQSGKMQYDVMTPSEFREGWDSLLRDDRFVLVEEEPADLEKRWREICSALPKGKTAETDTCLAAFALAGGHTLATLDRVVARFEGIRSAILLMVGRVCLPIAEALIDQCWRKRARMPLKPSLP